MDQSIENSVVPKVAFPHAYYGVMALYLPDNVTAVEDLSSYTVDVFSDAKNPEVDPDSAGFALAAEIHAPRLDHVFPASDGRFSDLLLDIEAVGANAKSLVKDEIIISVNDRYLDRRTFQKWYHHSQVFIPTRLLRHHDNIIEISVKRHGAKFAVVHNRIKFFIYNKNTVLDQLEASSIWIFSSPRSGSTWLSQDILGWKDRTRPVDESGLGRLLSPIELQPTRFFRLAERAVPFESGARFESGLAPRSHPGIPPFERHFAESARTEPMEQILAVEHRPMFCRHVRDFTLDHVLAIWGFRDYERIAFKCPGDSQGADIIMQAFPAAHMIFLVRDGRDVLRSEFSPFVSSEQLAQTDPERRKHFVVFYAHLWNFQMDIIRSAYEQHAPERRLLLRYEDLRREPLRVVRELFDHLGMGISDEELAELVRTTTLENLPAEQKGSDKPRQSGLIGGYRSVFDDSEIALMTAIMGENLRRYGYIDDAASEEDRSEMVPEDEGWVEPIDWAEPR